MAQNNDHAQQDLAQQRTEWAYERTRMSAIRTTLPCCGQGWPLPVAEP
jgi:uncharacterized membrane protein YidH (DUF202 family)